mmetsp:Transcript_71246/g.197861  ORF Transcript_71246/g.197861 Transcript_71246/m.197861 type:complete len:136 (+) Transcript_71246:3-410(+)
MRFVEEKEAAARMASDRIEAEQKAQASARLQKLVSYQAEKLRFQEAAAAFNEGLMRRRDEAVCAEQLEDFEARCRAEEELALVAEDKCRRQALERAKRVTHQHALKAQIEERAKQRTPSRETRLPQQQWPVSCMR